MIYEIIAIAKDTVFLWDRESKDDRGKYAGVMMLDVGLDHEFKQGDLVQIALVKYKEDRCEEQNQNDADGN